MKQKAALLLVLAMVIALIPMAALAAPAEDILVSHSVEYLGNGESIETEVYKCAIQPRTGTNGYKTATYRIGGTAIWAVTVNGSFSYTSGVSCRATSASAVVDIYSSAASFVSKDAYTNYNSAIASAVVRYNGINTSKSVTLSCDTYGNLS